MKNIIIYIFLIIIFFVFSISTGCKMATPTIKDYPESMSNFEKKLSFKYDKCVYAQSFNKIDLKCDNILDRAEKIENIIDYDLLKKEKKLPILYRKNSEDEMTFDDFFKYIK